MTKDEAELLVVYAERFEKVFNDASQVTYGMADKQEAVTVRKALGALLMCRFELEDMVLAQYPEYRARLRPPD